VVEFLECEGVLHLFLKSLANLEDFQFSDVIGHGLGGSAHIAPNLGFGADLGGMGPFYHEIHRLVESHPAGVQADIHHHPGRAPQLGLQLGELS